MKVKRAAQWLIAWLWLCGALAGAAESPLQALRLELSRTNSSSLYVLGPNDLIQLSVYGEEDLNVARRIGTDNRVTFPLIEPVRVGGLTVESAMRLVRDAYARDYLVSPKVVLTVIEATPRTFNILGFVKSPGAYPIRGDSVSLVDAIAMAGGGTPEAKLSRVTVMRGGEGQPKQVFKDLDAERMIRDPRTASFQVRPGDTIQVTDKVF